MLHKVHVGRHVRKELVVALAKVVQPWLAIGSDGKSVFRAFAVAGKQVVALLALTGQGVELHGSKLILAVGVEHLRECGLVDVAQLIFRKHKMVATINVAIIFHNGCMTATARHGTYAWLMAHPIAEGGIEDLHKHLAYVVAHPFVENCTEEIAPLHRTHTEIRERKVGAFVLNVRQMSAIGMAMNAFNDGGELQIATAYALKEIIKLQGIVGIKVVDHRHGVPLHAMLVEQTNALHHLMERGQTGTSATVFVVKLLRTIN